MKGIAAKGRGSEIFGSLHKEGIELFDILTLNLGDLDFLNNLYQA